MYTIGCVNEIILYFLKLADALTNLCTMNVLNSEWKNQNFGEFFHSPFKTTLYNYYEKLQCVDQSNQNQPSSLTSFSSCSI